MKYNLTITQLINQQKDKGLYHDFYTYSHELWCIVVHKLLNFKISKNPVYNFLFFLNLPTAYTHKFSKCNLFKNKQLIFPKDRLYPYTLCLLLLLEKYIKKELIVL